MINPDEVPMPLTNGRIAAQIHERGLRFGPSTDGGVVASFSAGSSDPAVVISFKVEGSEEFPIFVATSTTGVLLENEEAVRSIATTNRWNATHRFPTALVEVGPGNKAVVGTQLHLPAGGGLTDVQLHDLVGLAVSGALEFWRESGAGQPGEEDQEEGVA